jgi:DNA-directed RNA polymerase subunit F
MIGKESKHNGHVSLNQVRDILEERKKEKELTYEQQIALEHAEKFAPQKDSEHKVRKALDNLGTLSAQTVLLISNIMPKNEMLLRQILANEKRVFSEEEIKNIRSIIGQK